MAVFRPNILIILERSKSSGTHISESHLGTTFAFFLVGHGTKLIRKANIWPKMTKNAYFGPYLAVSLFSMGGSFGASITENHLGTLFALFFSAMGSNGPKMLKFGQVWPFLGQNPIFWGEGVKLLVPSYQGSNETPLLCWKHLPVRLQLAARDKNVQFWPQNLEMLGQKSIFCLESEFLSTGHITSIPGATTIPFGPPEKISVSELWVIFRGSSRFLAILGQSPIASISTLNFGQWSMKLGGTPQAKEWPTMTTDLVPAVITEKRPFLRFAERCFWPKTCFLLKKTPEVC